MMLKLALLLFSLPAFAAYNPNPLAPVLQTPPCTALSAAAIDWSTSNCFTQSNGATNRTYTFSNQNPGQTIVVYLTQTVGTPTWPTSPSLKWSNATTPSRSQGATDIYTFTYQGTTTYGSAVLAF